LSPFLNAIISRSLSFWSIFLFASKRIFFCLPQKKLPKKVFAVGLEPYAALLKFGFFKIRESFGVFIFLIGFFKGLIAKKIKNREGGF
jgi:hypothetical protein